jgi:hypothetical protein
MVLMHSVHSSGCANQCKDLVHRRLSMVVKFDNKQRHLWSILAHCRLPPAAGRWEAAKTRVNAAICKLWAVSLTFDLTTRASFIRTVLGFWIAFNPRCWSIGVEARRTGISSNTGISTPIMNCSTLRCTWHARRRYSCKYVATLINACVQVG